jgi:hypothetical protein
MILFFILVAVITAIVLFFVVSSVMTVIFAPFTKGMHL